MFVAPSEFTIELDLKDGPRQTLTAKKRGSQICLDVKINCCNGKTKQDFLYVIFQKLNEAVEK